MKTGRICSKISGGAADGGFTLNLKPGTHHLSGIQALTLARTRDNSCNVAYTDLNREAAQQEILNSIKSQLLTVHTFFHLPVGRVGRARRDPDRYGRLLADAAVPLRRAGRLGQAAPAHRVRIPRTTAPTVLVPNAANVRSEVHRLITGPLTHRRPAFDKLPC